MSGGMKELKLWQEAVALASDVVRLGRGAAKRETTVVTDRLMLAGTDVATRIAAGYTHGAASVQLGFYLRAREALVEVETLLAVARHAGLLATDAVLAASARAGGVHRLLAGYVAYLERQLAEEARAASAPSAVAGASGADTVLALPAGPSAAPAA
jgi:four helix bundle protein